MSKRATLPDTTPSIIVEKSRSSGTVRRYEKGRLLGKGGFARCYCIRDCATGKEYACKVVAKDSLKRSRAKQKLLTEIKIHRSLNHSNIVGFYRNFEDEKHVYILLELCTKQTLMELVKRHKYLSEDEVRRFGLQIIDATMYLHSKRVIHRDLKLGNLFLTHGADNHTSIRLGDFGLATQLQYDGEKRQTICGTPNYIAPEILNSKKGQGHSYEVDVWSLGCIFYTLLVGRPPFQTRNIKETYRRIRKVTYRFPSTPKVSEAAKYMIQRIFQIDPKQRPTLAQMRQMSFFTGAPLRRATPSKPLPVQRNQMVVDHHDTRENRNPNTNKGSLENHNCKYHYECNSNLLTVVNWIDYTSKYGLGYLMSNGLVGVYFNDSTKMVFRDTDCRNLNYVPRGVSISGPKHAQVLTLSMDKYPPELKKKVTLMSHFTDHLRKHRDSKGCVVKTSGCGAVSNHPMPVYVKRWVKTRHAFLFRLSNKTVQVSFSDKTELVLSSADDVIFYRGKQGELHRYHVTEAEDSKRNPSVAKRVKYANDIIRMLVSGATVRA